MGGPIPDIVYDYDYNDRMDYFVRGAEKFPYIRYLKYFWTNSNIIDSENNWCFYKWTLFQTTQKNYTRNKTDVYYIDDLCCLDIIDLKGYGAENYTGNRYILVVIDNFSTFGWIIPLTNKTSQTVTNSLENVLISSKRERILIEADRGKEFHNKIFRKF